MRGVRKASHDRKHGFHAHNTTKRLFIPNLRTIKSKVGGTSKKMKNLHEMFEGNVRNRIRIHLIKRINMILLKKKFFIYN